MTGALHLLAGLGDALHDLHIVDVEGADGVAAVIGLLKHFLGCYQCHNHHLLFRNNNLLFCTE